QAVVADLNQRAITTVLNLGDHASGPLWPQETLAFLMQQPWLQIAGNCDRKLVHQNPADHGASEHYAFERINPAQKAWLQALPAYAQFEQDLLLCHGRPTTDELALLETMTQGIVRLARPAEIRQRLVGVTERVVLCGHTHTPRLVQVDQTQLIVNPGSVGLPAYEDSEPEPHVIETGSPHARYAILEQQDRTWQVELVAIAYDYQSAANQARQNKRLDWEVGLRTGYMKA
ncbi:MAG: metallophosphoesterase family protein, partial [Chloroflexi bacterium]|nr:metallophosphoesterase family protein [Chloroflexota bacterium]